MEFLILNKFVTLVEDVMFMNGTPLLITMSLSINFVTVEHVPTCMDKQLSKYFKSVIRSYSRSSMLA